MSHHEHYHQHGPLEGCVICEIFELLRGLHSQTGRTMSKISDFADQVNANFQKIQDGIAALDAKIQAFQDSPGKLSAEDQAALDGIVAASSKLAEAASDPVAPPVTGA